MLSSFKDSTAQSTCASNNLNDISTSGHLQLATYNGTSGQNMVITQDVDLLSAVVTFSGTEINISQNKKITVHNHQTLIIDNSHLLCCEFMWQGIVVEQGGTVICQNNSLIEDAYIAIDMHTTILPDLHPNPLPANGISYTPSYTRSGSGNPTTYSSNSGVILNVSKTIFNRNQVGISISGYDLWQPLTTSLFSINSTVFTSRNLPFTTGNFNWPTYSQVTTTVTNNSGYPLSSEFISNSSYSISNLHYPNITLYPQSGIKLLYVGNEVIDNYTTGTNVHVVKPNPASYVYDITIGLASTSGNNNINIFDNLQTGIDASLSNLSVTNSVFQNMILITPATPPLPFNRTGTGIVADGGDVPCKRLIVNSASNSLSNGCRFTDCYTGINAYRMLTANVKYANFRSTQSLFTSLFSTMLSINHKGKYGFYYYGDKIYAHDISNNLFSNIENGIKYTLLFCPGGTVVGNISGHGFSGATYIGNIIINNNNFTNKITTTYLNNVVPSQFQFMNMGIQLECQTPDFTEPSSAISINGNTIEHAFNGIKTLGWNKPVSMIPSYFKDVNTIQNTISLEPNYSTGNILIGPALNVTQQAGIEYTNNWPANSNANSTANTIFNNTISLSGNNPAVKEYGITNKSSTLSKVQCNTVTGFDYGIEYDACGTSEFLRNTIKNVRTAGFEISNGTVIGIQGGTQVAPAADNKWLAPVGFPAWGNTAGTVPMTNVLNASSIGQAMNVRNLNVTGNFYYNPDLFGGGLILQRYRSFNNTLILLASNSMYSTCTSPLPKPPAATGGIDPTACIAIIQGLNRHGEPILDENGQPVVSELPSDEPSDEPYVSLATTDYIMQSQLYAMLRSLDDTIRDSLLVYPLINNFYTHALQGILVNTNDNLDDGQPVNMEALLQAEMNLNNGDWAMVQTICNSIIPANNIEQNLITYYTLCSRYYDADSLTADDSLTLRTLATACPATEGVAVYKAQVFYHSLFPYDLVGETDCVHNGQTEVPEEARLNGKHKTEKWITDEKSITIFPMPNNGSFEIAMPANSLPAKIEIYAIDGKQVFNADISEPNTLIATGLLNGVYFVKTTSSQNITVVKKLIIIHE